MPSPTGVIEQFFHAPLSLCSRELVSGTSSGSGSLQRIRGPILVDAQGLQVSFITVPAGFGRYDGSPVVFTDRICQLSVVHRLVDTSEVYSETFDVRYDGQIVQWSVALPDRVDFWIIPEVTVQFRWLVVL